MAHKKGAGSARNGRESESKRLGVKIYGGQGHGFFNYNYGEIPSGANLYYWKALAEFNIFLSWFALCD